MSKENRPPFAPPDQKRLVEIARRMVAAFDARNRRDLILACEDMGSLLRGYGMEMEGLPERSAAARYLDGWDFAYPPPPPPPWLQS